MAEGHGAGVLSAVAATQSAELTGIHLALGVDVAVTLVSVVLVWYGLRPRGKAGTHAAAVAAQREPAQSDEELAAAAD